MTPEETIKTAVERTRRANDLDERIYREAKEALENSLLIPKPKFKVGDRVKLTKSPRSGIVNFNSVRYDLENSEWIYEGYDWGSVVDYYESELELVEAAK